MSLETPATLRPTAIGERIATLDIARGIALFGIFMVNIQLMTQPLAWMFAGGGVNDGPIGAATHYATRVLFESKSYPLFSMLFGMGLILMYDRAKAAGRSFAPAYLRRITLLLGFGISHAFLVWYGDILIYYACFAIVIMWLAPLKPRTMFIIACVLVGLSAVWGSGLNYLFVLMGQNAKAPPAIEVSTFEGFRTALFERQIQDGPANAAWKIGETDAIANGPFINAVAMRAINWASGTIFWMMLYGVVLHVPAMFLLGGAIMRSGILTDPASPWAKRFMLLGLLVGFPGAVLSVVMSEIHGPTSELAALSSGLTHLVGPFVSLAYIGLAMWLARSAAGMWLVRAVASAGRMALTNYLMQSLLVAAIAQHWGLGLFGEVSRLGMLGIVVGIYLGQLAFSTLWLSRFAMGPLEYLWRCGTYLRLPTLTKRTGPAG